METILFYIFGGLTVATAFGVVFFKNPISSAFSLVVSFFGIAALYAMLNAHFLAVIQILVYAGAIMVLFIFVIMLLNLQADELHEKEFPKIYSAISVVALLGFLYAFTHLLQSTQWVFPAISESFGNVKEVGKLLFTEYLVPFEYSSILLLVAVIAGVVLAKRDL